MSATAQARHHEAPTTTTVVLHERPLKSAGMVQRIELTERHGEESVLVVERLRNGQPAGGVFVHARDVGPVALAAVRARQNPPHVGVAGWFALRSGASFEVSVGRSFNRGVFGGTVVFTLVMPTGERRRPTVLDGEALEALDMAIDLISRGGSDRISHAD